MMIKQFHKRTTAGKCLSKRSHEWLKTLLLQLKMKTFRGPRHQYQG